MVCGYPLDTFREKSSDFWTPFTTYTLPPFLHFFRLSISALRRTESRVVWFVWRRTCQCCISWRTRAPQRLDSGSPGHAPRTSHSIKEARQSPTSAYIRQILFKIAASWATRPPSGETHAPNVFAQSHDLEGVNLPTFK